jgi:pimeloyl-ACP methyl ester carboxylesterase
MANGDGYDTIEVDGRRVGWRTLGEGPRLVLLNGYSATAQDWDPGFLGALTATFQVICPDHRGMGQSTLGDPDLPMTIDGLVDDLERVLDALGDDRFAVAGWSMGGFVAQRLAVRAPERVASLALLGTDPGGSRAVRAEPWAWDALLDHSGTPREQASRIVPLLFPPALVPVIDEAFGDLIAEARAALDPIALRGQQRAMRQWHADDQPRPEPATAPRVLALHGSEDVVIPAANLEALAAVWPACALERFDGAAHAFMAQDPTGVGAAITTFARPG